MAITGARGGRTAQYAAGTGLPTGSSARTVDLWFKTTTAPTAPYGSALVAWGTETGTQLFSIKLYNATTVKLTNWNGDYFYSLTAGQNVTDGAWHYLAVTFGGSNATVYYDGQSLGTQAVVFTTVTNATGLALSSQLGANNSDYVGFIDEVAVYNTAIPASRILAHFQSR